MSIFLCGLRFHSGNGIFWWAEAIKKARPTLLIISFMVSVFVSRLRSICLTQSHENILWCNLDVLFFCFLHWGLWSIYSWLLDEVEAKVHFPPICISNWSSVIFKPFFPLLYCCSILFVSQIHVHVGLYLGHSFFLVWSFSFLFTEYTCHNTVYLRYATY